VEVLNFGTKESFLGIFSWLDKQYRRGAVVKSALSRVAAHSLLKTFLLGNSPRTREEG